eukprot:1725164-Amphidinium_carterae.1
MGAGVRTPINTFIHSCNLMKHKNQHNLTAKILSCSHAIHIVDAPGARVCILLQPQASTRLNKHFRGTLTAFSASGNKRLGWGHQKRKAQMSKQNLHQSNAHVIARMQDYHPSDGKS